MSAFSCNSNHKIMTGKKTFGRNRPELPNSNRLHKGEDMTDDYIAGEIL